ncbi:MULTISPECIES: DUF1517 domain-containing protein [Pseudanabaena]|uniref:DUF1517 domain-containing protein n=2 Tax=Pseudanabaena TaxID=1152 RepID=L8MSH0_9CYAN|nr:MULTISPECIES: DUF1517 domain-containing protein [Pseudanabaena]ELS30396.1 hypothetical protein Pse7429DRAFT_4468 [Pseudanabaena biceps PCC 7429]MDG3497328.1 DUF1517 domain-containing protein [Pseudanabaena catenata USMAC16]
MKFFSSEFIQKAKAIAKRSARSLFALLLVAMVLFGNTHEALAKRSGGRMGGSAFRAAPSRSIPSNSGYSNRSSYSNSRSYSPIGGGGGFFFLPMFFGGGGGGLFSILLLVIVAGAVLQAFRGRGDGEGITGTDNKVTVAKIQVGLLSSARSLQQELTRLALESDTSSVEGLATVTRETAISLMRHPEYWVYVSSASENTQFALAEQKFNGLVMSERSKLNAEVLSNVSGRILQGKAAASSLPTSFPSEGNLSLEDPSEYIVVTILIATAGETLAKLPTLRSSSDLQASLAAIGSIPADNLLAVEVLWEPQSEEYTLTTDEILTIYPDLVRI